MNKKNLFIIALLLTVILGGGLRFYNLGVRSFDRDEFFELNTSYGYFKTGKFLAWDFNNGQPFEGGLQDDTSTERAEVFRWQLANLYDFTEPTEANTRAVSAIWGVISIILVYFMALSFTGNKYIALIAAFLVAVGESEIIYSRRLRMYSMFFPVYLFFSWLVFKFYEAKYEGNIKLLRKISEKTGLNPAYFIPALIFGLISFDTQALTASIVGTIFVYSLVNLIISISKKSYFNKYSITLIAISGAYLAVSRLPAFHKYYKFAKKNLHLFMENYRYLSDYFSDMVFPAVGFILLLFGVWFLAKKLNRKKETAFIFLSAAVPLAAAIFTWSREPALRYIYFLQSFGMILIASGIFAAINFISGKFSKYRKPVILVVLIIFTILVNFRYLSEDSEVYRHTKNSYYPDFSKIFPYILENKKPGDVFITRAYRSYYFRGEKITVYDTQELPLEKSNCREVFEKIISENKSGWVIIPKVDYASVCKDGRQYLSENLSRVRADAIPTSVPTYRWGNN
jgi:hypothetical protein